MCPAIAFRWCASHPEHGRSPFFSRSRFWYRAAAAERDKQTITRAAYLGRIFTHDRPPSAAPSRNTGWPGVSYCARICCLKFLLLLGRPLALLSSQLTQTGGRGGRSENMSIGEMDGARAGGGNSNNRSVPNT